MARYLWDSHHQTIEWSEVTMAPDAKRHQQAIEKRDQANRARLGPDLELIIAGRWVRQPEEPPSKQWSAHCCLVDSECREYLAPPRLHVSTPWHALTLGLLPGSGVTTRYAGWTLGPLSVEPHRHHLCYNVVALEFTGPYLTTYRLCPLKQGHRSGCLDWKEGAYRQLPHVVHTELAEEVTPQ